MQKLFKFRHKKALNEGFTTLEVLVSIIVALAFVSVAMQSFVLAMAMKVQAQEKQRANQLIQEDLENVSILASNIPAEELSSTPPHTFAQKCNAVPAGGGTVAYANGFAQDLWDNVEPAGSTNPTVQLLRAANGDESGKTLTLDRTHVSGGSSTAPHRSLKINYQVTDPDGEVIAERYVEVIPDVALRCP